MRIGIDASSATSPNWGGPENYSYYLIRALAELDKNNQYFLYTNRSPVRPLPDQSNFSTVVFNIPRLWTHIGLPLKIARDNLDLFFSPAHSLPFFFPRKIPCVYTVHDLAFMFLPRFYTPSSRLYLKSTVSYSSSRADTVLSVSVSTKRDLVERLHIREDKIQVVHNGYQEDVFYRVSEDKVARVLEKYNIKSPYILNVATIQPRKNHTRLIEAFSQIAEKYKDDCLYKDISLVLVGKPGWQYDSIYQAPQRFGIADKVRFLGHLPDSDIPALMSGAALLAYPSLYEGFGLAPIEAMACGNIVLTSNISSLPEAVGSSGILIDPYSVDDIVSGIAQILNMPEAEREALISVGLKRVKEFSWRLCAQKTLNCFLETYEHNRYPCN